MTGRRDIELCQTVIEQFYKAEQMMAELRSGFAYPSIESADRPKPEGETKAERDHRDSLYVPLARWQKQREFWSELFALKFRMRALFGDAAAEPFDLLHQAVREFTSSASVRYEMDLNGTDSADAELRRSFSAALWASPANEDKIGPLLRKAIPAMENICIPIVRARLPLWKRLF